MGACATAVAAGIALATAFILQYLASGTIRVEDRLRILPVNWIGLSLLLAAITGMASWLFGYPFLTTSFTYVSWPLVGKFELATAMIFDAGVYITVVGATLLILTALGHQSVRGHRRVSTDARGAGGQTPGEP
mgnify:CR=1 FL=1